jgi:8-oxo-dGTP diphosphatase
MSSRLHVAVGVIVDSQNQVLISQRANSAHQGGLWEFPGGKVEPGETVQQALQRELQEELDIAVAGSEPLLEVSYDYPDKSVLLDVHVVRDYDGKARGLEGQPIAWVIPAALADYTFPAANQPILEAVQKLFCGG